MPKFPTKEQRAEKMRAFEAAISKKKGIGAVYGLAKGMSITMKTMLKPAITAQYPHQKPDLPPRTRGVIALKEENCTVCMLCSRECPDWCIYIDSHKEVMPPKTPGARSRSRNVLDRFAIDYALCMYCGICVEVCPFDALFWSPHFEYSTEDLTTLTHEMPKLGEWMALVPPPPPLDEGAEAPVEFKAEAKVYGEAVGAAGSAAGTGNPTVPAAQPAAPAAAATATVEPATAGAAADSATEAGAPTGAAETQSVAEPGAPAGQTVQGQPAAEAAAAAAAPAVKHDDEPPQIDEETYKAKLAEGKSEREARALAKKAWVLKRRQG